MTTPSMAGGAIAFVTCVVAVPIIRACCKTWKLFDLPGPLKTHSQPIPRLGGIAIAFALSAGILFSSRGATVRPWPFICALGLIWIGGLIDDFRGLHPIFRLATQIAGTAIIWAAGWRFPLLGNGFIDFVATCGFVILHVNALNFMDGADGVAAGVTSVIAIAYILLPHSIQMLYNSGVAWSLLGACLGFLLFNFPKADIFMGDSGSTTIGFAVAFLALDVSRLQGNQIRVLCFALLAAGLPLLDATLSVLRRLRSRTSPFYGDRSHFYDLLASLGWSSRQGAVTCYAITALFAIFGWFNVQGNATRGVLCSAGLIALLMVVEVSLGAMRGPRPDLNGPAPDGVASATVSRES